MAVSTTYVHTQPEGNLFRDRQASLQARAMLEPRKQIAYGFPSGPHAPHNHPYAHPRPHTAPTAHVHARRVRRRYKREEYLPKKYRDGPVA